jgi:hypothetical protein
MDRTPEYHALMQEPEIDETLDSFEQRLRGHTILFVPGFLSDAMRPIYFLDQLRYFRSLRSRFDVRAELAAVDGEDSPERNATKLRDAVLDVEDGRPLILFTHSKGSLDTLHMLVGDEALWPRIASWVSVQGALLGSPVADHVSSDPILRAVADQLLELVFKGSRRALSSLRTDQSRTFVESKAESVSRLCKAIKILCYGSAISGWTALGPFRDRMLERDLRNDGLMPIEHTFLPGADLIRNLEGPDHAAVVMPGAPVFFDRPRFSRVLMGMALTR